MERLSARGDHRPESTLVTTGTGSGKTECFLYPLLDHCRRARQRGEQGIKAIILYPMNALASDQAERIAKELSRPELKGVSAGLYVGGQGEHGDQGPTYLIDKRDILRKSPPDVLLTNYRMLDLLLLRPEDRSLWERNGPETLRYLVLDELHTYDGAQGSDVACLIRRLKERLATPKGHLCCVGTSATIGSGSSQDPRRLLLEFASKVFGESFGDESIVGEDRLTVKEALPEEIEGFDEAPLMNSVCERFLGSVRREALDHVLILGERHLESVLDEYAFRYFNKARPHQGLGQCVPLSKPQRICADADKVVAMPVLGGLHHNYRVAA